MTLYQVCIKTCKFKMVIFLIDLEQAKNNNLTTFHISIYAKMATHVLNAKMQKLNIYHINNLP